MMSRAAKIAGHAIEEEPEGAPFISDAGLFRSFASVLFSQLNQQYV
jgi:hypothetical protein